MNKEDTATFISLSFILLIILFFIAIWFANDYENNNPKEIKAGKDLCDSINGLYKYSYSSYDKCIVIINNYYYAKAICYGSNCNTTYSNGDSAYWKGDWDDI